MYQSWRERERGKENATGKENGGRKEGIMRRERRNIFAREEEGTQEREKMYMYDARKVR